MITIEAMLLRRRVLEQSAKRHRRRKVPQAQPPKGLVLEYTRFLMDLSHEMDQIIFEALKAERVVRLDDILPPLSSQIRRVMDVVTRRLAQVVSRRSLIGSLERLATRVGDFTRAQWQKQLHAALGIDLVGDIDMGLFVSAFRRQNLELITSLSQDKVNRVRSVLNEAGPERRVEHIAADIQEQTDATDSRAALIARDQVLTLNSQVMQARHEAAGITQYIWSTSHDARVRKEHQILDGHAFSYSSPPVVDEKTGRRANPGQDFQCRCIADPVIPGLAN